MFLRVAAIYAKIVHFVVSKNAIEIQIHTQNYNYYSRKS